MNTKQMTFEQIQATLKKRDILFADIAEACNVTRSHVSLIAKGQSTSHHVAKSICLALNLPINQVFGDKYDNPGRRTGKHRADRKQQVIASLKAMQPVPPNESNVTG